MLISVGLIQGLRSSCDRQPESNQNNVDNYKTMLKTKERSGRYWALDWPRSSPVWKKVGLDWTVPKRLYSPTLITFCFVIEFFKTYNPSSTS